MQQDHTNINNPEEEAQNENEKQSSDRFQSDTQKIVRRHLEDEDHVITDEEMENIRVGMTPPEAAKTTARQLLDKDALDEAEKKVVGDKDDLEEGENDKDKRIVTPWDTIDPD